MRRLIASVCILALAGCSSTVLQKVGQDIAGAASVAQSICTNVVPSAEAAATAAVPLLNNANATAAVNSTIPYITAACSAEAKVAGSISSGWLQSVLSNLSVTAMTGSAGTAPAGQTGS